MIPSQPAGEYGVAADWAPLRSVAVRAAQRQLQDPVAAEDCARDALLCA